jgi:hypothetical protein
MEEAYGEDDPILLRSLDGLAEAYRKQSAVREAGATEQRAAHIRAKKR